MRGFALALVLLVSPLCAFAQAILPAPEFPEGLPWINVERPLTLEDLRGKAVVLDFWTYGCINCLHVADELKELEKEFGDRLAVISVHTPKFDNERDLDTLKSNVKRYSLKHPVIQDEDYLLMEAYGAPAWPTVSVVDLKGRYVGRLVGEGVNRKLRPYLTKLFDRQADLIDESPLPLKLEADKPAGAGLSAPGKIAVGGDLVAISDTLNNRIVVTDRAGKVLHIYGDGIPGLVNGKVEKARFRMPQGLLILEDKIYVADTGNHVIRLIDMKRGRVTTLAGTGKLGRSPRFVGETDGRDIDLRSPWDLEVDGKNLYIAMAGGHQVWRLDLTNGRMGVFAGSGREGIDDGKGPRATFSQPTGLDIHGRTLFVVDAEASAVRRINLDTAEVETIVGTGLFDFGLKDGPLSKAEFQHPADVVALDENSLIVADTYNHGLREIDLKKGRVRTLVGDGKAGQTLGKSARLNEPSGINLVSDESSKERLLVVDTNNDRIVAVQADSGIVETWAIQW